MTRNCLAHRAAQIFALAFLFAQPCPAQEKISDAEKLLFDSVNHERAARGLALLKWEEGLARAARKHAARMAEQDLLEHQVPGEADLATRAREEGVSFSHITENIGMGASADKFHDGWMHSPGHRANILDAVSDSVGIAVVEGGEQVFAVEDFARVVTLLPIEQQKNGSGNSSPLAGCACSTLETTPGRTVISTATMREGTSRGTSRTTKRQTYRSCLRA